MNVQQTAIPAAVWPPVTIQSAVTTVPAYLAASVMDLPAQVTCYNV